MEIDKKNIKIDGSKLKIAIVVPYFNESLTLELLKNAKTELLANRVKEKNIAVVRVAGSLEIPFACQKISQRKKVDAIIALGVIIKGETSHYDLVSKNCYEGLMQVQLKTGIPIACCVLACENLKQAQKRVSKKGLNKGKQAACAALIQATL